jgi:putative cell wall-binding protein
VSRVAADDRYATAAAIAQDTFTAPVPAVFLASGEDFPDALSGGPAAGTRGPILLTRGDTLPADTVTALQRLRPAVVYVLGGENAVPASVATQVAAYAPTVTRLAGVSRYGTGKLIAKALWPNGAGTVYLSSGVSFPDALSGGVLAVRDGAPILLSAPGKLPTPAANALTKLAPTRVVLLGGTAALSDVVAAEVGQLLPGATVSRIAGADRFATSAMVAQAGWSTAPLGYFAAGDNFPDALAGVPAAAANGAPLLLARPRCLPAPVYGEAQSLGLQQRILLGGTSALMDGAATTPCAG